jgi:hypothetical protein
VAFGFTLEVAQSRLGYVESLVDSLVERTSVPREAVILEVSDDCPRIRYLPPWEGPVDRPPRSAII